MTVQRWHDGTAPPGTTPSCAFLEQQNALPHPVQARCYRRPVTAEHVAKRATVRELPVEVLVVDHGHGAVTGPGQIGTPCIS